MVNREDFGPALDQPIDDAVALHEQLPRVVSTDLRYGAPEPGMVDEPSHCGSYLQRELLSPCGRVACNEAADVFQFVRGMFTPRYLNHWRIRSTTTS